MSALAEACSSGEEKVVARARRPWRQLGAAPRQARPARARPAPPSRPRRSGKRSSSSLTYGEAGPLVPHRHPRQPGRVVLLARSAPEPRPGELSLTGWRQVAPARPTPARSCRAPYMKGCHRCGRRPAARALRRRPDLTQGGRAGRPGRDGVGLPPAPRARAEGHPRSSPLLQGVIRASRAGAHGHLSPVGRLAGTEPPGLGRAPPPSGPGPVPAGQPGGTGGQRRARTCSGYSPDPACELIAGHAPGGDRNAPTAPSERDHLAVLALPYVGAPYADGMLRGIALATPVGTSGPELLTLQEALRSWAATGPSIAGWSGAYPLASPVGSQSCWAEPTTTMTSWWLSRGGGGPGRPGPGQR